MGPHHQYSDSVSRPPTTVATTGGPSLIPTGHGGALRSGGTPGHKGANQHTVRKRAEVVRGRFLGQLEEIADDLEALLSTARESDGDRVRCKNCGSYIPAVSKLNLTDILAVIRELRAILPAQVEHDGLAHQSVSSERASGAVSVGPSLIAQRHGGALLSGGKPGNLGNRSRHAGAAVRERYLKQLDGVADDLEALLSTARESDGDRVRCKNCGAFIPGVSKLKLTEILAVFRELKAVLPTQAQHEGGSPIQVIVAAGAPVPAKHPDEM